MLVAVVSLPSGGSKEVTVPWIAYETVLDGILKTSWLVDKDLAFLERRVQAD
jgi:hypothetical protein